MASTFVSLIFCSLLFTIISPSIATTSFRPKAVVLPVTKDTSTLQYTTQLQQRTPLVPIKLTIDIGGKFLWVDCDQGYVSSSYKPSHCHSAQCNLARSKACGECSSSPKPGCNNNTCSLFPYNPFIRTSTIGELAQDVISLQSTNGFNPSKVVSVPKVIFNCGSTFLLEGLASGVKGIVGLGRDKIGIPLQFASAFSFNRKFAICLSSSTTSKGVIFFGNEPYVLLPGIDVSKSLVYTPLIFNPVSSTAGFEGEPSSDYFIGVKGIKINNKFVKFNTSLLSIDKEGNGGTKISTVNPYTVLEASIYNAVVNAFVKVLSGISRVEAISPFGACFNSSKIGSTRVGPAVPSIDLVLQNEKVFWRIFGANSMVRVKDDVLCVGFVDGGVNPRTSIVIGGYQLENNLVQIDLASSRLGFSSSLLFRQTTCSNFNFTSIA